MAETTDEVKAEIAQTRANMEYTINEIAAQLDATRRRIPFYGWQPRQYYMLAGGLAAATAAVFLAFYVLKRR